MRKVLAILLVAFGVTMTADFANARQMMANYSTVLHENDKNRVNNIKLALKRVNGIIVYPEEEFSFNKVVGKRTTERGYKKASAFFKGQKVPSIGGGICQVSSTLYAATRQLEGIEIIERYPHSLPVSYIPKGMDATVSWGTKDFRFVNHYPFPLHIVAGLDGNYVYVKIFE